MVYRGHHNKYPVIIDAELDVHGMTREEAKSAVLSFLDKSIDYGYARVRIIVGKGLHSPDGKGVLADAVGSVLTTEGYDWSEAKVTEGGSGAIDVQLRNGSSNTKLY